MLQGHFVFKTNRVSDHIESRKKAWIDVNWLAIWKGNLNLNYLSDQYVVKPLLGSSHHFSSKLKLKFVY